MYLSPCLWVTHREWVASVCLGDFTLFRQALQECPAIRPTGSCSTDLLGHHWPMWSPAVWKHRLCNLLSLCSCPQLSPTVCPAVGQTRWLNPYVRPSPSLVTVKKKKHHNSSVLVAQWEAVRTRCSGSLETGVTDGWEMLRLRRSQVIGLRKTTSWFHWFYVALLLVVSLHSLPGGSTSCPITEKFKYPKINLRLRQFPLAVFIRCKQVKKNRLTV